MCRDEPQGFVARVPKDPDLAVEITLSTQVPVLSMAGPGSSPDALNAARPAGSRNLLSACSRDCLKAQRRGD